MDQPQKYTRAEFIAKVRAFENRLLAGMKDIFVPVHLCLGQEGVAADIYEVIRPQDWLFSTHRNHGHFLAKGGSEQELWDEIHGLESGLNQGFSGSQGISDAKINFHASAIVGGLVSVAVGTALAIKMDKRDAIVVCCVGDGATEAGVFWESLNFYALHQLPIAFIVENNGMSVDCPIEDRQYGSIGKKVEGFGVFSADSVHEALDGAMAGFGPTFHEAKVKLECSHIYMANLLPKEVIA